jgi:hypothetical protein
VRRVYGFLGVDDGFTPATLERDFYQTKDRAPRSPVPVWLRKGLKKHFPAAKRAKELENNVVARLERMRSHRRPSAPAKTFVLAPRTRDRLAAMLADDVRQLRSIIGPDFDGWGIA